MLAEKCKLKVFYTWGEQSQAKFDPGFGKTIEWDIPLLEGYDYRFSKNISKKPGSHGFFGIVNPDLIETIEDFSPDALLIYGWAYKSHLSAMRYFGGKVPVWFRGDSTLLDEQSGLKKSLRNIFLRWIYSHVDRAFYVGSANKEYFLKFGISEHQLVFCPHAIDNTRFEQDRTRDAQELRKKLNLGDDDFLVLFAGKLEPKKNPELLFAAFERLDQENLHLLIVGNGVLEEKLKAERFTLNTKERLHFLDFQNQQMMPAIYQACDLFCLPSQGPGETWGLAVNEAMATGKPVLVSDKVGCATDLVKNGINGYVFKSQDEPDLTDKLKLLTGNKGNLSVLGAYSRLTIEKWSFALQVEALIAELEKL